MAGIGPVVAGGSLATRSTKAYMTLLLSTSRTLTSPRPPASVRSGGLPRAGGEVARIASVRGRARDAVRVGRDRREQDLGRPVGLRAALLPVAQRAERQPVAIGELDLADPQAPPQTQHAVDVARASPAGRAPSRPRSAPGPGPGRHQPLRRSRRRSGAEAAPPRPGPRSSVPSPELARISARVASRNEIGCQRNSPFSAPRAPRSDQHPRTNPAGDPNSTFPAGTRAAGRPARREGLPSGFADVREVEAVFAQFSPPLGIGNHPHRISLRNMRSRVNSVGTRGAGRRSSLVAADVASHHWSCALAWDQSGKPWRRILKRARRAGSYGRLATIDASVGDV